MVNKVVTDRAGRVIAVGGEELTAQTGQQASETGLTIADFRAADEVGRVGGQPYAIVFDGKSFVAVSRDKSASELDLDDRAEIAGKLQIALDNWAKLTAAQKDALLLVCVRGVLRMVR